MHNFHSSLRHSCQNNDGSHFHNEECRGWLSQSVTHSSNCWPAEALRKLSYQNFSEINASHHSFINRLIYGNPAYSRHYIVY
ncbi:unnamed protein product [Hymenolepis diminuta]|uniref:Uncharacterized protein n=1 Tax=Hymenolepis diminuta TaxID=6216 RepID=A0A564YQJ0_HYMDI|nr:unnamed protein product [Hymenolepis diminuta]